MSIPVRDLRNHSAAALARVRKGERIVVTKDREPVTAVVPLPRRALSAAELIARRRRLPRVDAAQLRRDLDEVLDPSL